MQVCARGIKAHYQTPDTQGSSLSCDKDNLCIHTGYLVYSRPWYGIVHILNNSIPDFFKN